MKPVDTNENMVYQYDFTQMSEKEVREALELSPDDEITWNKQGRMTVNGKMVSSIPKEALAVMQRFYVENEDVSLKQVAEIFGVKCSTLKTRAEKGKWKDLKEGHTKLKKLSGKTKLYYVLKSRKLEFLYDVLEEIERIIKVGKKLGKENGKLFFNGKDIKEILECHEIVTQAIMKASTKEQDEEEIGKVEASGILEEVLGISVEEMEKALEHADSELIEVEYKQ